MSPHLILGSVKLADTFGFDLFAFNSLLFQPDQHKHRIDSLARDRLGLADLVRRMWDTEDCADCGGLPLEAPNVRLGQRST